MSREPSATTLEATASSQLGGETIQNGILWIHPERRFDAFASGVTTFGRSDDCTYCLPGGQVSRLHAQVEQGSQGPLLTDAGSRNGCLLNRKPVVQSLLQPQDVLRLGNWVGVVLSLTEHDQPLTQVADHIILGPAATRVHAQAIRAAASQLPIIVYGETGSGKEVLATTIHRAGGRAGQFVAVNCAALPEGLAEAELFGYRKGAFTGAHQSSLGHFRAAHQGTLLLDEVADLPLALQAKLLRALEERSVVPLGESMPIQVDLKLLAAGQQPLVAAVEAGRFRSDLYARLRGVELHLPPLRERREEIVPIFLNQARRALNEQREDASQRQSSDTSPVLSTDFAELLCTYRWPMNVREVVQVARQVAVLYPTHSVWSASLLPESMRTDPASLDPQKTALGDPSNSVLEGPQGRRAEAERLLRHLERTGGNVSQAAAALGISRQRAYRLLESYPDLDLARLRAGR